MTRATIHQTDGQLGFCWVDSRGAPASLKTVASEPGSEPERLVPTHLEALDDVLIAAAGTLGDVLGGGQQPTPEARRDLQALYRAVDRATHEYDEALRHTGLPTEIRAGQIVGTATLMGYFARGCLDLTAPPPLDAELDDPGVGVVGGYGELIPVDPDRPSHGQRWVVRTEDGRRLPASLSMLLFDSSGVAKDPALDEHRAALDKTVTSASEDEPTASAAAIDWLLHDWLMAHRDGPSSGAVEITSGKLTDVLMIVRAAAASARLRATYDPGLLDAPRRLV